MRIKYQFLAMCAFWMFLGSTAYWFVSILLLKQLSPIANLLWGAVASCYFAQRLAVAGSEGLRVRQSELIALLLLIACGIALTCQAVLLQEVEDGDGFLTLARNRDGFINNALWVFVGASVARYRSNPSDVLALVLTIFTVSIIWNAGVESGGVTSILYQELYRDTSLEGGVNHLTFSFLLIILWAISYSHSKWLKPIVFLAFIVAAFPLGSRTAMYIGLISVLLFELLYGRRRIFRLMLTAIGIATALAAVEYYQQFGFEAGAERMLFEEGVDEDASAEGRLYFLEQAMPMLPQQFLFGDPVLVVERLEFSGAIAHNILSAWQLFGFPVFALIILSLFVAVKQMRVSHDGAVFPMRDAGTIILIYTILSELFAHGVQNRILWFTIGFWLLGSGMLGDLSFAKRRRRRRRRSGSRSRTRVASEGAI